MRTTKTVKLDIEVGTEMVSIAVYKEEKFVPAKPKPEPTSAYLSRLHLTKGTRDWDATDAKTICAAIRQSKMERYDFNPTIIEGPAGFIDNNLVNTLAGRPPFDESQLQPFRNYLTFLKNTPRPLRERFCITGQHWITGDISIDANGKIQILILCSMGTDYKGLGMLHINTKKFIELIYEAFPEAEIYLPNIKRQRTEEPLCPVFALDDLRKLHTVEKYLPAEYKDTGLYGFLKAKSTEQPGKHETTKIMPIKFTDKAGRERTHYLHCCAVPLPFMRSTQTSKLFLEMLNERKSELSTPLNKSGEKLTPSQPPHYFNNDKDKWVNMRIYQKLEKLRIKTLLFVGTCKGNGAEQAAECHSIDAFKSKINTKRKI